MGTGRVLAFLAITIVVVAAEPLKKEVLNLPPLIHFTDVFNSQSDKEHEKLTELSWGGTPGGVPPPPGGGYPGGGYPGGGYPGGGYPGGGYPGGGYPGGGYPGGGYPGGGYPGGGHPGGGYPGGIIPPGGGYPGGITPPGGGYPGGIIPPGGGYPGGGYPGGIIPPGTGYPGGWPPNPYPQCPRPPYPQPGYPPQPYPLPGPRPPLYPQLPPIKPPYSRQQDVELVERFFKFNDDGSKEYKLVLSNGLSIYQKVLNKNDDKHNVQLLEGYYSDKRDDNTYLTTYFRADEKGYSASSEITDSPPSFPNVKEMISLPLPSVHNKQKH